MIAAAQVDPGGDPTTTTLFAEHIHGVHRRDLDLEQGLDRFFDLNLVGIRVHVEGVLIQRIGHIVVGAHPRY